MTHLPTRPFPPLREPQASARDPWAPPAPRGAWHRFVAWCQDAAQRRRTRRLLAQLDNRQLHDIGISRSEAAAEAQKPFWRL
ncbi:DUF1127 domain-containing protein [Roseococcus suduntuyensis]|uniref:Uncharacterized protein YjiS (DUF1127 family) n=1 Tax=Roseococcus suduntuyensis TaxID=455361 RepID=A0A840AB03_9PROT|nr:DUF1127 domain-containing protein [Roseococcus suduntuyensis]MBB3897444.1 uncharacterized protein YjiS (DUF1127 family) [Roseococcus suduntuyensis]